ncbi:zinc-binding dehydrogenase [Microbacterium sp. AGC85]
MKALILEKAGRPDTLRIDSLPLPIPGEGELRIAVHACGLNPSDFQRAHYGVIEWEWPAVLGLDPAGIVDAVGPGVTRFAVGDRVVAHNDIRVRGGFAEHTVVSELATTHVPDGVSFTDAAAIPAAGLTALQAIRRLQVTDEDIALITGAGGGVGGYALQLANTRGAQTIATDSARNADRVYDLGANEFLDFETQDIPEQVRRITNGDGVDAILDTINSESATANATLLRFGGRIATTAGRPDISVIPPFSIGPSTHEIALGAAYTRGNDRDQERLGTGLAELLSLVAVGKLDPMVGHTVTLAEVAAALTALSERRLAGKAVYVA